MDNKSRFSVRAGVLASILYITVLILIAIATTIPTSLNEWGDYFAGTLQPLALAWFVATLVLQARELSAQREELNLTREEMKEAREVWSAQKEEQKRLAAATERANELATKGQFLSSILTLTGAMNSAASGVLVDLVKIEHVENKYINKVNADAIYTHAWNALFSKASLDAPGLDQLHIFFREAASVAITNSTRDYLFLSKSQNYEILLELCKQMSDEAAAVNLSHLVPVHIRQIYSNLTQ